jgi:hypothetical protein
MLDLHDGNDTKKENDLLREEMCGLQTVCVDRKLAGGTTGVFCGVAAR